MIICNLGGQKFNKLTVIKFSHLRSKLKRGLSLNQILKK